MLCRVIYVETKVTPPNVLTLASRATTVLIGNYQLLNGMVPGYLGTPQEVKEAPQTRGLAIRAGDHEEGAEYLDSTSNLCWIRVAPSKQLEQVWAQVRGGCCVVDCVAEGTVVEKGISSSSR